MLSATRPLPKQLPWVVEGAEAVEFRAYRLDYPRAPVLARASVCRVALIGMSPRVPSPCLVNIGRRR